MQMAAAFISFIALAACRQSPIRLWSRCQFVLDVRLPWKRLNLMFGYADQLSLGHALFGVVPMSAILSDRYGIMLGRGFAVPC